MLHRLRTSCTTIDTPYYKDLITDVPDDADGYTAEDGYGADADANALKNTGEDTDAVSEEAAYSRRTDEPVSGVPSAEDLTPSEVQDACRCVIPSYMSCRT